MSWRRRTVGALALASLVAAMLFACSGQDSHVFQGRLYVESKDCLDETVAIDVVDGPDPGQGCDAICISGHSPLVGDGGLAFYVATQCPPYPPTFDLTQDSPTCASALAAAVRVDHCTDTGSTNPFDASALDADAAAGDGDSDAADGLDAAGGLDAADAP